MRASVAASSTAPHPQVSPRHHIPAHWLASLSRPQLLDDAKERACILKATSPLSIWFETAANEPAPLAPLPGAVEADIADADAADAADADMPAADNALAGDAYTDAQQAASRKPGSRTTKAK